MRREAIRELEQHPFTLNHVQARHSGAAKRSPEPMNTAVCAPSRAVAIMDPELCRSPGMTEPGMAHPERMLL